jgi:hypothetical protein
MSFKGKDIRNAYRWSVPSLLWRGGIDKAVSVMENAAPLKIKDHKRLKVAIGYLNRKSSFIPDRALRKAFGLRLCGSLGEKANDSAVSSRQKHNGMSWSREESAGRASVCRSLTKGEPGERVRNHTVRLNPVPVKAMAGEPDQALARAAQPQPIARVLFFCYDSSVLLSAECS